MPDMWKGMVGTWGGGGARMKGGRGEGKIRLESFPCTLCSRLQSGQVALAA